MISFYQGFESTGKFAVILSKIATKDIPNFFQVYFIILFAFGFALGLLTLNENPGPSTISGIKILLFIK